MREQQNHPTSHKLQMYVYQDDKHGPDQDVCIRRPPLSRCYPCRIIDGIATSVASSDMRQTLLQRAIRTSFKNGAIATSQGSTAWQPMAAHSTAETAAEPTKEQDAWGCRSTTAARRRTKSVPARCQARRIYTLRQRNVDAWGAISATLINTSAVYVEWSVQ